MVRVKPLTNRYETQEILVNLKKESLRDYYITMIALTTGLRITDILNLKVWQFRNHHDITVVEEKTKKIKYTIK